MGETHDQVETSSSGAHGQPDRGTARLAAWALWLGIGGLVPLLIPVVLVVAVVVLVRVRRPGLASPTCRCW
ncbi:hypothetical protein JOF53_001379 [Crossiella equi]|uniref:Uncharacterized protein n=1 Tax=Crossiella equi TaxID=130796 RepID=A0ABS5A7D6_9PSEU|nr:hypothetical protein [Crossiella equi]MBP2472507.1 hypothetical protein [Crossiella equi]